MDSLLSIAPTGPISFSLPTHPTKDLNLSNLLMRSLAILPICSSAVVQYSSQLILLQAYQEFPLRLSLTAPQDRCWNQHAILRIYAAELDEDMPEYPETLSPDANQSLITQLLRKHSKLYHVDVPLFCILQPPLVLIPAEAHPEGLTFYEVKMAWPKKNLPNQLSEPLYQKLSTYGSLKSIYPSPLKIVAEFVGPVSSPPFIEIQDFELKYIFTFTKILPLGNNILWSQIIDLDPIQIPNSRLNPINIHQIAQLSQNQAIPAPLFERLQSPEEQESLLFNISSKPVEQSEKEIVNLQMSKDLDVSPLPVSSGQQHFVQPLFQTSLEQKRDPLGTVIEQGEGVAKIPDKPEEKLEKLQEPQIVKTEAQAQEKYLRVSEEPEIEIDQLKELKQQQQEMLVRQPQPKPEPNSHVLQQPISNFSIPRILALKQSFQQNSESSIYVRAKQTRSRSSEKLLLVAGEQPRLKTVHEFKSSSPITYNEAVIQNERHRAMAETRGQRTQNCQEKLAEEAPKGNINHNSLNPTNPKVLGTSQSSAVINIEEPSRKIEQVKNFEMPGTVLNMLIHEKRLYVLLFETMLVYDLDSSLGQQPPKRYTFQPLDDTQIKAHTPMIMLTLFPIPGSSAAPVPLIMFANDSSLYYINLKSSYSDWKYVQRKEIFCLEGLSGLNAVLVGGRNFSKLSYIGKGTSRSNVKVYSLGNKFDHIYTYDLQGSSNGDVNSMMRIPGTAINRGANTRLTELVLIQTTCSLHFLEVIGLTEIVTLLRVPIVDIGLQSIIGMVSTAWAIYILEDLEIARCVKKLKIIMAGKENFKIDLFTENARLRAGPILSISKIGNIGVAALYGDGNLQFLSQQVLQKSFCTSLQHPASQVCGDEFLQNGGNYIALLNRRTITVRRREWDMMG